MRLDRPLAEEERGGDLAVRPAVGHERRDATLRRRQALLAGATADPAELGPGLLGPGRSTQPFELPERGGNRVAGGALLALASADDTERKQRPSPAERVLGDLMPHNRILQQEPGPVDGAPCSGDENPAASHVREHPAAF